MFRLAKLAFYGLVGYAAYEFIRGVVDGPATPAPSPARKGGRSTRRSIEQTPEIEGQPVQTHDTDGATTHTKVGRGVVPR